MDLKLSTERKPQAVDRVSQRREKLASNINAQITKVAEAAGGATPRGVWFWKAKDGKYLLSIKYGRTDLELSKGMFSIQCADLPDVKEGLENVREMAQKGELDDALQNASETLRAKFKKSK